MPTSDAVKRLDGMRNSARGWKPDDLIYVYENYGFIVRAGGGGHYVATHSAYKDVRATFPMTGELLPVYVRKAIRQIDTIATRRKSDGQNG